MKKIVVLPIFLLSFSVYAADECKPIHKSEPITFSVSAKKELDSISSIMEVKGNELSPVQPAEKLNYLAGALRFSITPVTSCKTGVQVDFVGFDGKKQRLLPWGESVVIDGKSDSEYFVKVTAAKAKP